LLERLDKLEAAATDLKHRLSTLAPAAKFDMPGAQWVREQLADLGRLLREADPIALATLREMIGRIQADSVVTPGKINGYAVIRFRPNLPRLVMSMITQDLPLAGSIRFESSNLEDELPEVKIALGEPTRADTMAPLIYSMRKEGKTWPEIQVATGYSFPGASRIFKRYQAWVEANKI